MMHRYIKGQYLRISAISLVAVVAVLFLLIYAFFVPETAYAVCPDGYVKAVEEELDWYMGADYLNLERVCEIVDGWLSSDLYDFTDLEKEPIVIAIIDTGIQLEHELFAGKYDENGNAVEIDGIGEYDVLLRDETGEVVCANTYNAKESVEDVAADRHGTHVAGIAATLIHKLNLEKYIKLLPIKASYPDGKASKFTNASIKAAVKFALDNGADVINMSLSGDSNYKYSRLLEDGYGSLAENAVFVAAAGNNSKNSDRTTYYPAGSDNVLGIMSYKLDDEGNIALSDKSNYGSAYELCLPGAEIYSADGGADDMQAYKKMSGTSMASPIASVAVALAMLKDRAQAEMLGCEHLSASDIAELVKGSYSTSICKETLTTKTYVNVFDFVKLLEGDMSLGILCDCDSVEIRRGAAAAVSFSAQADEKMDLSKAQWSVTNSQGETVYSASGASICFKTEYADIYRIVLTLKDGDRTYTASRTLAISYIVPSKDEISAIHPDVKGAGADVVVKDNESVVVLSSESRLQFDINSLGYEFITPTTDILWYVNDKYIGSGESFACSFESSGEYLVRAKINGELTSAVRVIVQIENKQSKAAMQVVGIAFALLIPVCFVLSLVLGAIKRR